MTEHLIGELTLNISTAIYLIWFIPQLLLTFRRKSTEGLSFWMHGLLGIGYLSDLMYGFGRHLPWQYRLVTLCGLLFLAIEHYQFGVYGLRERSDKVSYFILNFIFLGLIAFSLENIVLMHRSRQFYDFAGGLSNLCWFSFVIPQIIKNYVNKSAEGVSRTFIILIMLAGVCDIVSAFALRWDWPSKVGSPIGLFKKSILLGQSLYYEKRQKLQLSFEEV